MLVVFFAFMPPTETRAEVRVWSSEEQQHSKIVALVAALERSGCTVATAGLDLETGLALPVLAGLESSGDERTCGDGSAYFVLPSSRTRASRFSRRALRQAASSRLSSDSCSGSTGAPGCVEAPPSCSLPHDSSR